MAVSTKSRPNPVLAISRPETFTMSIHSGMLESLGLNMYTSIGKCLVEFAANGYDADAENVDIDIPFEEIEKARKTIRDRAKQEAESGKRAKYTVLSEPLPDDIEVVIRDDGHGMGPEAIEDRFLVINRNRRKDSDPVTSKGRYVMGRKGLGKLAGFGTAEVITVRSKRRDDDFATTFKMDYNVLREKESIHQAQFPAHYESGHDKDDSWTEIRLSRLRCDALRYHEETIKSTLARNFYALEDPDFRIQVNTAPLEYPEPAYEFKWPPDEDCAVGFVHEKVKTADGFAFDIRYRVMFRAREGDTTGKKKQGHLPAAMRGARIYCNKRLAMGPSLFSLHSGMHNFHSQSYMEAVVHADDLDRSDVDHINTNRTEMKGDNEVVDALCSKVTEIMRLALREHAKHREQKTDEDLEKSALAKTILESTKGMSETVRHSTRKVLNLLARDEGVHSDFFTAAAPLLPSCMNSGEVLVRLSKMGLNPESMLLLTHELVELRRIECRDVLKLYRGRSSAINALAKLYKRSLTEQGAGFEKELHQLLKDNPWLIDPALSHVLTSDKPMGAVAKNLDRELGIDTAVDDNEAITDPARPDLAFVLTDQGVDEIRIVELKSPGIRLDSGHAEQLRSYMAKASNYLGADHPNLKVIGYLIGTLPNKNAVAEKQMTLLYDLNQLGPESKWHVRSVEQLLANARKVHQNILSALEQEEEQLNEELS